MNNSFYVLSEEKKSRIINAAIKIFALNPYSKASTDDIAALAGISKGSLFYHFKNKKDLYRYLYEISCKKIYEKIEEKKIMETNDFFERNMKVAEARVAAMIEFPYIFDFLLRAYYEIDSNAVNSIKSINEDILKDAYIKLNENMDISKFKNKEDVNKAIKMLLWVGDGLMKERKAGNR